MDDLHNRALKLEYFTVGYNLVEAFVALFLGGLASSIALIGFGLDSIVESLSGLVLIWRLKKHGIASVEEEETIEKKAERFVAVTFLILGAYVLFESVKKLYFKEAPEPSLPGIILAIVSIIVMPILGFKKYRLGKIIKSRALVADSKETFACSFLSVALLIGLGANYIFGFWQADSLAGLVIVFFLFREGVEGLKESLSQ